MLRVVTAPAAELVTLAEVKAQLRLSHTSEDDLLRLLRATAIEQVEAVTQRRYLTQTLEWVLQAWPRRLLLPVAGAPSAPTADVAWVKYRDQAGVQQTLDPATYDVRPLHQGTLILPKRGAPCLPILGDDPEPVVIHFSLGGAPGAVPPSVKLAVLLTVESLYDNRAAAEPPATVQSILFSELWEA